MNDEDDGNRNPKWTEDIKMDQKSRKLLSMHGTHYPRTETKPNYGNFISAGKEKV